MAEFHTVSISNNLSLRELYKINDIYFHNEIAGELSTEDIKNRLTKLYPRGISIHGMSYLSTKPKYHSKDNYKDNLISNMKHIESLFKLVRLWKFPSKPYRFISTFGCEIINKAIKFKKNTEQKPFRYLKFIQNNFLRQI